MRSWKSKMKINKELVRWRFALLVFFFLTIVTIDSIGQNYGLEFTAREKNPDYRTELDLSANKSFKFKEDFELSFDLLLRKQVIHTSYFGYILRVISNDQYNIDLMHNKIFVDSIDLNMVFGENMPKISYDFDSSIHFNHWINIRLRFNISSHELEFILPDTSFTQSNIPFDYNQPTKFIFGACDYGRFKTRDIPPFNLRDVKIFVDDKLKHHWPLNEYEGTEAKDIVHNKMGRVRHPNWIKKMHLEWLKSLEYSLKGNVLVAANTDEEKIYLIGNEEMLIYSLSDNSTQLILYDIKLSQFSTEQAIYVPGTNSIYCYDIDNHKISIFDLANQKWTFSESVNQEFRGFRHHNKFLSTTDSMLYLFGGYGYHEYKNEVQTVNLHTMEWNKLEGDWNEIFKPRYLAALGGEKDTVYLLGGYGSSTGDQMISPQNFHELLAYSTTNNSFVHKFDLEFPDEDLVFGNSMIIDSENHYYYALSFSRFNVNNSLQLVRGNLNEPTIEQVADEIPYIHFDTKSYVDLYYFPTSGYLVTYTGISDESGNTNIELHKLRFPPNSTPSSTDSKSLINAKNSVIVLMIVLAVVVYLAFHYVKKKRVREMDNLSHSVTSETEEWEQITNEFGLQEVRSSAIHCFGGFRVFDATRTDITGEFTPLLKELYLLLLLHTVKDDKGISSEKLLEILWFDKSLESARNNRAVNIAKLRAVLEKVGNFEITHDTGYWKIICYDPEVYNDYCGFVQITQSIKNPDKRDILKLIKIAGKGPFLGNVSYEWLDSFKSTTSDSIINSLIRFSDSLDIKKDAHLIIQMADCIFNFDSINEDAMILKCKSHHAMGSHSLPKSTYTKFKKEYKTLYGEDYEVSFADVINKSRSEIISA
jgi:two-component SAPR family response regulator